MSGNLFNPPAKFSLPLSLGQDLVVDFQSKDAQGSPVNYADGTTVALVIEGTHAANVNATVSTYHAVCFMPSSTADQIPSFARWRCVATVPGGLGTPDTVEVVLANGTVTRFDGN